MLLNNIFSNLPQWVLFLILVWSVFWTGLALWKAARQGQRNWFIAMLILSTIGILEIVYLAFFQKKTKKPMSLNYIT